jgi:hypothetical protein
MQPSVTNGLRRRFFIAVRKIRAVFGALRQMRRSPSGSVIDRNNLDRHRLSNSLGSVGRRKLQTGAICSNAKDAKRQLEGRVDHLNTDLLSGSASILRESRGSMGSESPREEEIIGTGQRGIDNVPFLHLGVQFESSQAPNAKAIESLLNKAKDWYRYAPNCWIIYTGSNADTWSKRLRAIPGMENHSSFFICELNFSDRSGWMQQGFWDWVGKHRA